MQTTRELERNKRGSALKRNRDSPLHSPKECIFNYQIQKGCGPSYRAPPELHLKIENLESLEGFAWEEAPQGKMGRQEERRCRVGVRKILIKTPEGGREGGGERDHSQMARALTKINFGRRATLNLMGRAGRGMQGRPGVSCSLARIWSGCKKRRQSANSERNV